MGLSDRLSALDDRALGPWPPLPRPWTPQVGRLVPAADALGRLRLAADVAAAVSLVAAVTALARAAGDPDALGQAALGIGTGLLLGLVLAVLLVGDARAQRVLLDRALPVDPDVPRRGPSGRDAAAAALAGLAVGALAAGLLLLPGAPGALAGAAVVAAVLVRRRLAAVAAWERATGERALLPLPGGLPTQRTGLYRAPAREAVGAPGPGGAAR